MTPRPSSVHAPNGDDPLWYKDAVVYQLHVKSFFDANDDGVGDFAGLLAKLDYIAELGVDTLWLLPFYPSPRRDDGYDIADYRGVHPDYGTLADVKRLIAAAHARGMRIITELVVNHTSDQHPWFERARRAKPGSAARNRYVWSDNDQAYAGTRIIFCDTESSNWTWDPVAGAYYWHRFYAHQPDLNYDNPAVLKDVLAAMHFWLDLGVDGLRLDAVPYLVEREGTNNENLPETHAILRAIRADLDAAYQGRLLLAEANQWPEDAQEYFGQGDECHMSFHFPLMPRMYMAIAREDRFPITDIMRQTPDIPENCQWAIFLRNHDELTLEMVTSSDRDYLWDVYAADRRARINLGIRRRLAPLLERDRRRIELMNSLLLSMPGTPVIYYGDEIGMGDNIHLGDRDGVRTPMQWSPDRNGGFSRADPEQLVLPPLMGALYGAGAVNVEAQHRDPHSLLNWMRRMLAKRRQHVAFGRGTLRFLFPNNRRILAYVRQHEEDTLLCVANLSHATQPVELDMADFAGRIPVEMLGGAEFPAVGQLPYLLTLPPYGFYWFALRPPAAATNAQAPGADASPEYATLVLRGTAGHTFTDGAQRTLQADVLPAWLARRRWFAGKDHAIGATTLAYVVPLPGDDSHSALVEITVNAPDGPSRYFVPWTLTWESPLSDEAQRLALAAIRRGPRMGMLIDAFAHAGFASALLQALRQSRELSLPDGGHIRFIAEPALASLFEREPAFDDGAVRWLSAEQSNSSFVLDDACVVKLVRRVQPGIHPEAEMTRHLGQQAQARVSALLGEVVRTDADGTPHTLALVQAYVPNQGDAWVWTQTFLTRVVHAAEVTGESGEAYAQQLQGYEGLAAAIGRRLAQLHATLAQPSDDPAFSPEPAQARDVTERAQAVRAQLERALDVVAAHVWQDGTPQAAQAATLASRRPALMAQVDALAAFEREALHIRIHGDFHLGQVLVSQGDVWLIDFEGEPARSLAERRARSNPMRDVAGLLRSIDYAAAMAALPDAASHPAGAGTIDSPASPLIEARRQDVLARFRQQAGQAFLDAYDAVARQADPPWMPPTALGPLLDLALLEKAAYEVCFEAANRPDWVAIPLRGLAELAERLTPASPATGATTPGTPS